MRRKGLLATAARASVHAAVLAIGAGSPPKAQALDFVEAEPLPGLIQASAVAVARDGLHVYATAGSSDALVAFARDIETGELTWIETENDGINGVDGLNEATSVTVSPDGGHVYVASPRDDAVSVFARDETTGELDFVEAQFDGVNGVDGLAGCHMAIVSPDNRHVYASGSVEDAVAVFERNQTTGALSFVEVVFDGVNGFDGLEGVLGLALDRTGTHLYAAGFREDAVAVLRRNATSGALSFVEAIFTSGSDGLDGVNFATVSQDGENVYTVSLEQPPGFGENALSVFARDASSGKLTFVQALFDGVGDVDGIRGASSIAVQPGGTHVYVTGNHDWTLVVFERDASSGELGFVEAIFDGVNGVDGLSGARWVDTSLDGEYVYTASTGDAAVAVFATPLASVPALGPGGLFLLASALVLAATVRLRRLRPGLSAA